MGIQTMEIFRVPSLHFGIKLALLSATSFMNEFYPNKLHASITSDELLSVIDDSFVGSTQLFMKDIKRDIRMDVYVKDGHKRVDIYSENKNRPFFIQICDLDDC